MRVGLLTEWYDPQPQSTAFPSVSTRWPVAGGHEVQALAGYDFNCAGLRLHALSPATLPNKKRAYLAADRPLLMAAAGDAVAVIRDRRVGFTLDPGDPGTITTAIRPARDLGRHGPPGMGGHARKYCECTFSVDRRLGGIESLPNKVAAPRKQAP